MNINIFIIKSWIKKIPFALQVKRRITPLLFSLVFSHSNKIILKQLENSRYEQGKKIREALILLQRELSQSDKDWKNKIEAEREFLMRHTEPLNDGSLSESGLVNNGVSIKTACCLFSQPAKPALLLFLLTRVMKPLNVIELGTNVGISSAYIGAAMKVNGQNGKIATIDVSPYRLRVAKELHQNLGIDNILYFEGLFSNTLSKALTGLGSIDLAFIDGDHQYQPTLDYFEEIIKFSTSNTIIVFDDIRWSDGMKKAWSRIQSDDRLGLIIDLSSMGLCTPRQQEISQRFVSDPIYLF